MRGIQEVIDVLNQALANEMVAISQYFMHSRISKNRGYDAISEQQRKQALDEMEHAEALTDRILFLEGVPAMQMPHPPQIGATVREQIQNDLTLEGQARQALNDGIAVARTKGDNISAALLAKILADEEKHTNWSETQLALIDKLGENAYLAALLRA